MCQYNKGRELLAQGLSYAKNMERSQEQERAERRLAPRFAGHGDGPAVLGPKHGVKMCELTKTCVSLISSMMVSEGFL